MTRRLRGLRMSPVCGPLSPVITTIKGNDPTNAWGLIVIGNLGLGHPQLEAADQIEAYFTCSYRQLFVLLFSLLFRQGRRRRGAGHLRPSPRNRVEQPTCGRDPLSTPEAYQAFIHTLSERSAVCDPRD